MRTHSGSHALLDCLTIATGSRASTVAATVETRSQTRMGREVGWKEGVGVREGSWAETRGASNRSAWARVGMGYCYLTRWAQHVMKDRSATLAAATAEIQEEREGEQANGDA